jgi:hypothetical protein
MEKRNYGKNKTKTLNGRITNSFHSSLKEVAEKTGLSQANLLELAWIEYIDNKDNFTNCPKCKGINFPLSLLNVDGIMSCKCRKCGNEFKHDCTF